MSKLMQVKGNGCILYFPETFPQQFRYRGPTGFVIDLDAPLEREWCEGQMHKLEPAEKGAKPAPLTNPIAIRLQNAEAARIASLPKLDGKSASEVKAEDPDDLEVKPRAAAATKVVA